MHLVGTFSFTRDRVYVVNLGRLPHSVSCPPSFEVRTLSLTRPGANVIMTVSYFEARTNTASFIRPPSRRSSSLHSS